MRNTNIPEAKKTLNDTIAADKECEREVANWIQHKVKWKKTYNKKELSLDNNEKIDTCNYLWRVNVKIILDRLIKESGEERKFGYLPEMCYNSPVQLGALTSKSFSKRMASAANLLVDAHRLHLNDKMIDELIALCMDKKFMDRIRSNNVFLPCSLRTSILIRGLKFNFSSLFLF